VKLKEVLKKFGEKNAEVAIDPRSVPRWHYEPKPPAKLQEKIEQASENI